MTNTDFFARRAAAQASQAAQDADAASARRAYDAARVSLTVALARRDARRQAQVANGRRIAALVAALVR